MSGVQCRADRPDDPRRGRPASRAAGCFRTHDRWPGAAAGRALGAASAAARASRLWRRSLQLRVVATTLLMSLGVVLLLGFVLIGQVRNGLLDAKEKAAQTRPTGGFSGRQQKADELGARRAEHGRHRRRRRPSNNSWLPDLVQQLASGGHGAFDVVALLRRRRRRRRLRRAPRAARLRRRRLRPASRWRCARAVDRRHGRSSRRTRRSGTRTRPTTAAASRRWSSAAARTTPTGKPYELYYLFPLTRRSRR